MASMCSHEGHFSDGAMFHHNGDRRAECLVPPEKYPLVLGPS